MWDLYNGAKQYKVPLFQRPYVWSRKQWEQLWSDIQEQYVLKVNPDNKSYPSRFLGSIVVLREYEKNLDKYTIIDGQQRITTISILLAVIKAFARERGLPELYSQIADFLKNNPKSGEGRYVVIPTRVDKTALYNIFDENYAFDQDSRIVECFDFFWYQLDHNINADLNLLQQVITEDLCVVYIELEEEENPNQVFEALNYRGVPLEESDLIRNFFFAHLESQEIAEAQYDQFWKPMEERLFNDQETISGFLRHFCMRKGRIIRSGEIFEVIRKRYQNATADEIRLLLRDINRGSEYYRQIISQENDSGKGYPEQDIYRSLLRIKRIGNNNAAPFLLLLLAAGDRHRNPDAPMSEEDLLKELLIIESYLVRRAVCSRPEDGYEDVFEFLCRAFSEGKGYLTPVEINSLIGALSPPFDMPDDDEFLDHLKYSDLYYPETNNFLAFCILERLEENFSVKSKGEDHSKSYDLFEDESEELHGKRMIDHIMPESLSDWWLDHLGPDWSSVHPDFLHRLGNLTLIQENAGILNADFETKKNWYVLDNLMLNNSIKSIKFWRKFQIDQRSGVLAVFCLKIWPMAERDRVKPGEVSSSDNCMRQGDIPKYVKPVNLSIMNNSYPVKFWYQVLEKTVLVIYEKEPKKFERVVREYSGFFSDDPKKYKSVIGHYSFKSRFGRYQIRDMCLNLIRLVGWKDEVWCLACE